MASRERVVEFAVKARDEYSKVLRNLEQQQKRLSASAAAQNRRAVIGVAKGEIETAVANYKRLNSEVDRYRAVQANAARTGALSAAEMRELGDTIKLVRDRSREAMGALQQKRAALQQINGEARVGFASFSRLATEMQRGAVASANESVSLVNTTAELNKLTTASKKAAAAQGSLGDRMDSVINAGGGTSATSRNRRKKGEEQEVELYGLKGYQLGNLGYQVSDVVSGLAMGQNPFQILTQQAGQFIQIWPKAMENLIRYAPRIAGATAILAPFVAAALRLKEAGDSAEYFQKKFALSADSSRHSSEELAKAAAVIKGLDISIDDARSMVANFAESGIPTGQFKEYAKLAKAIGEVTGADVGEAGKKLSDAFTGNLDSVLDLNKELGFLTVSQHDQVLAMKASGDEAGAMSYAFSILKGNAEQNKVAITEWGAALKEMHGAWTDLVDALESTGVIEFVAREWRLFGRDVENVTKSVRAGAKSLNDLVSPDLEVQIRELRATIASEETWRRNAGLGSADPESPDLIAQRNRLLALENQLRRETVEHIKDEALYSDDATAATRAATTATTQKTNAAREAAGQIIEQMNQEARLAQLSERNRYIEQKALEAENKLREKSIGLRKEEMAAEVEKVRVAAAAQFDRQRFSAASGSGYVDWIVGAESGGDPNAKNPRSSATGLGQFLDSTWLNLFKKYFPDRAVGMTNELILELRKNAQLSKTMIDLYAQENADIIQKAGLSVDAAAKRLAHFLGPTDAIKVLKADAATPVSELLGADKIAANREVLAGKNAGQVRQWAQPNFNIPDAAVAAQAQMVESGQQYLVDFQKRNEQQQFELSLLNKTAREAAILKAVREEELKAREAGLPFLEQERKAVAERTARDFDSKNINLDVNKLLEERSILLERMQLAQESGDISLYASTATELDGILAKLKEIIPTAIAAWQALGGEEAAKAIAILRNTQLEIGSITQRFQTQFLPTAEDINRELADVGSNAFSAFAEAIANGENSVEAFFSALRQGIAEFLIDIGKAIVKQALFNMLTGGKDAGGGIGGAIAGAITRVFGAKHSGGLVGQTTQTRRVNPMVFAGAQRYHGGGIVTDGLRQGEVPIVALEGEEVLTENDPRHSANGGGGKAVNLKVVNAFSAEEVLEAALSSVAGERILTNWMTRNSNKVNGALGR